MKEERARELVAAERARIEAALRELSRDVRDDAALLRQQAGESKEEGTGLEMQEVDMAMVQSLNDQLLAVDRAEERISAGTFGRSIESGALIPDDRLEVAPLAERTVEEQLALERGDR